MKRKALVKVVLVGLVLALAGQVGAQQQRGRGPGMYGDWLLKIEFDGRTMESILTFSRDAEGNRTAQLISLWGVSDLTDLKFEEGKLTFTQTRQGRDGQTFTSKFSGSIAEGKLTGTMSSDRGEYTMTGQRAPRMPRVVGTYEMKAQGEEREFTSTLTVAVDKEGKLGATWKTEWGEPKISDVQYTRGQLTFKMESSNPERQWEANFQAQLSADGLSGAIKSERGEMEVAGTRKNARVIGTWDLEMASERGTRKQRLRINPDMSALYGATTIKKVDFADEKMSFKIVLTFGERQFEMDFQGKLEEGKLVGEMTTPMGSQKITGTKVVRRRRTRSTQP